MTSLQTEKGVNKSPAPGLGSGRRLLLVLGCVLWVIVVGAGTLWLTSYVNAAGKFTPAPATLEPSTNGRFTLQMFLHPRCPCSQASVRELARLMARGQDKLETHVEVYCPEHEQDSWIESPLVENLREIPGVQIRIDRGGQASAASGAATSGEVRLYDPAGQLQFQGGIIAGRGHEGDNRGSQAVLDLIRGYSTTTQQSPAFGCTLRHE
jgi:hypothetical protein